MKNTILKHSNTHTTNQNDASTSLFYAQVNANTINVRQKPKGNILGKWPKGRIALCQMSKRPKWYQTRFNGKTAFVDSIFLQKLSTKPQNDYKARIKTLYPLEIGRHKAEFFDGASGEWCQSFVNWLLKAVFLPNERIPKTSNTALAIQFWLKNANFYFKNAKLKQNLNRKYHLGVGENLTPFEQTYIPTFGDIIYFRWNSKPKDAVSHTGLVIDVNATHVHTLEGNTEDGVMKKSYSLNDVQIVGYAKPNYTFTSH